MHWTCSKTCVNRTMICFLLSAMLKIHWWFCRIFYRTLVADLCNCWTDVPLCFFYISLHGNSPVFLMCYVSLKVSDIVEGDEFVCFVDFCWNQHSLVRTALHTVFYIKKTTKQRKGVLRAKVRSSTIKRPIQLRQICSFGRLDS